MTPQEIVTQLRKIASYSTSKKDVCTQAADLIEELTITVGVYKGKRREFYLKGHENGVTFVQKTLEQALDRENNKVPKTGFKLSERGRANEKIL